jgi:hypothetical protein
VVERHERLDLVGKQLVDEPVVEIEAGRVHAAPSFGQDPRPGDREPESVQTEVPHQRDVVAVPVVEVARDESGVPGPDLARCRREAIPDALAAAVFGRRPLDLVRGGRGTPDEFSGEESVEIVGHRVPSGQVMDSRT